MKKKQHKTVDDYLADLPAPQRNSLERVRKTIKATVPKVEEGISYGIPMYKQSGILVGFAAFANHCSFMVASTGVMKDFAEELKPYDTSAGTIRFPSNQPPPVSLLKKLIKARVTENEERVAKRKQKQKSQRQK